MAPIVLTALASALVAAIAVWRLMPAPVPPQVVRFAVPSPPDVAPRGAGVGRHVVAISPQGTHFVYWAGERLHLRALDHLDDDTIIRGTESAREPFFSPDGQWIGFHHDGQLKRVAVGGGAPIAVGATANPWGVSWDTDGVIRYGQGPGGIWQVPPFGGAPSQLIAVGNGEVAHGPQLLPGGEWLLFTLVPVSHDSWDEAQIVAQSLRSGERVVLIDRGRDARYVSSGHLVYGLNGVLLAVPFDARTRRVTGPAVPLVDGVMDADIRTGAMHYAVSNTGTLVYLSGVSGERSTLTWVDRTGRREPLPAGARAYSHPRVSPDAARVAVEVADRRGTHIYILDLARKSLTRLTSSPVPERFPLWTPDSQRVVFYSDAGGGGMYSMAADGTGTARRLTTSRAPQSPYAWTDEGRTLLFEERSTDQLAAADIYALSLDGDAKATPLVRTSASDGEPAISPNGRWVAYSSAEGFIKDVYVRPYPQVDAARWRISTEGGDSPIWSADGKQLFYIGGGRAMAAPIETSPAFRAGTPTALFELPPFYRSGARIGREWDITPDGNRFLIVNPGEAATTEGARSQIVVVINWLEELKRLVPPK